MAHVDAKSLPTFDVAAERKPSLRKTVSLQADHFYPIGTSDFSLFPQTRCRFVEPPFRTNF
jgi:hypothetical protein